MYFFLSLITFVYRIQKPLECFSNFVESAQEVKSVSIGLVDVGRALPHSFLLLLLL